MDDGSSFAHLRDANTANATNSKLFAGKISGQKRPCEVPFLFATFSLGTQRKSRRHLQKKNHKSTLLPAAIKYMTKSVGQCEGFKIIMKN